MVWPGLNAPILRGQNLVSRELLPPDQERERRLMEIRDGMGQKTHRVLHPLERGWSGTKMGGRSVGPPDPVGDGNVVGGLRLDDLKVTDNLTVILMQLILILSTSTKH